MVHWNSSPHPISDIRDWADLGRLELRPDFQRREVWSSPARIMLMDTILRGVPMPKIFVASRIKEGGTYRAVIDGQQRITSILAFLRDEFALDEPFTIKEGKGRLFSELDKETQDAFLSYTIDFNEAINPTDEEVREVYARVNKYTVPLSKQELRRADFPGDFLRVSERLALNNHFDRFGLFSAANRRRYADVEYVSELLAAMIGGIQDKKESLDDFYIKLTNWENKERKKIKDRFYTTLEEIDFIFKETIDGIFKTRFRQKADFYTLFLVIDGFISEGRTVKGKNLIPLREDLMILQDHIRPESHIEICSEYAIKCVSQANSASSRRWRHEFLKSILAGSYLPFHAGTKGIKQIYRLREELDREFGFCPESIVVCPICEEKISIDTEGFKNFTLAWDNKDGLRQVSNARWIHPSCAESKNNTSWTVLRYSDDEQTDIL